MTRFTIELARRGAVVEVCLLYVVPPAHNGEVLRLKTDQEIRSPIQERMRIVLEAAAAPLQAAGIPCRSYFLETEPVFGILDLAEQLDCTTIVVPKPDWLARITHGLSCSLKSAQRSIPVVLVCPDGSVAQ